MMTNRPVRKSFVLLLILIVWFAIEWMTQIFLSHMQWSQSRAFGFPIPKNALWPSHRKILDALVAGQSPYLVIDAQLGWTIRPGGHLKDCQANAQGCRADHPYAPRPAKNTLRIVTFGDSFTHGNDVVLDGTWQVALEKRLRPTLSTEVLNFGVPAYGTDQVLMRYRVECPRYGNFSGDIVTLGIMSENIYRLLNVYRPNYCEDTTLPLAKPRFGLESGKLVQHECPLRDRASYRELLDHSHAVLPRISHLDTFYQTRFPDDVLHSVPTYRLYSLFSYRDPAVANGVYDTNSEAFRILTRIVDTFWEEATIRKSVPLILLFPDSIDLEAYRKFGESRPRAYAPLLVHLRAHGYRFLDLMDTLGKDSHSLEELTSVHYTPLGNQLVANALAQLILHLSAAGIPPLRK